MACGDSTGGFLVTLAARFFLFESHRGRSIPNDRDFLGLLPKRSDMVEVFLAEIARARLDRVRPLFIVDVDSRMMIRVNEAMKV